MRAMAADPAERFPDMAAFAGALRHSRGQVPFRTSSRRGWMAGVAVAVAVAIGAAWMASRETGRTVTSAAETIAVLPFSASGPGVEFLGEGMVDLLATNFSGVGGIRTVDPRAVIRRWGGRGGGGADRLRQALVIGRDLGAGSVVMGSVVSAGGRVRLAADLYSTAGDQLGRAQVDGPADSVLQLVDRMSVILLRDVWRSREPLPNLDLASLTTDSLAALRAFLEGERLYRRLSFDSAIAAYTRATEVDSTFALAQLRRALVYGWTGGHGSDSSRAASAAGARFAERLSPRHRRLLQSYSLFERSKPASVDSARAFVAQYPDDLEGWFLLGEALYHTREYAGATPDSVMMPFDTVLRRDSALVPAAIHPMELALRYRDRARFDRYLSVFRRAATPGEVTAVRTGGALVWGPQPTDSQLGAALAANPGPIVFAVHSIYSRDDATSDTVVRYFGRLQPSGPQGREFASEVLAVRADVLAGLGRVEEAGLLADSLAAIAPAEAGRRFRWPIVLGMAPDPRDSARIDSLARSQPDGSMAEYVQAVIGLSRGQVGAVRRRLADRLRVPDTSAADAIGRGQLTTVLGLADLMAGDSALGLRRLEEGLEAAAAPRSRGPTTFIRFQQALALSSGQATRREGIQRLRHSFDSEPLFLPLSYLALGQAYEAAGESDSAAFAYGRFLRLWDKADPVFQDRIVEARDALQRLTAEPRQ
ncbi:MAG: hypothetical protein H0T68_01855 [Gemmatimonadales bacterium]|nr:hypothetical protein [Gemmatimonadales bacterium]